MKYIDSYNYIQKKLLKIINTEEVADIVKLLLCCKIYKKTTRNSRKCKRPPCPTSHNVILRWVAPSTHSPQEFSTQVLVANQIRQRLQCTASHNISINVAEYILGL